MTVKIDYDTLLIQWEEWYEVPRLDELTEDMINNKFKCGIKTGIHF